MSGLDWQSELMFQQAYWNDQEVVVVYRGVISARGIVRLWWNERQAEILANVKQADGSWIREVKLKNIKLASEMEGL